MDHALYTYSALPSRPRAQGSARVQAYVLLCLEHWHAEPPPGALKDPRFVGEFGSFTPDYRSWTQREYGLRVGVFRVMDALREAGLVPAVAVNAELLDRVPRLLRHLSEWGCEWIAHAQAANALMHARMDLDAQRQHIGQALQACQRVLGHRPAGWLSQDWGTTPQTHELLREAGVAYTLDWCNDEQAYLMNSPGERPLVAVPLSPEWDDVQAQWLRQLTPRAHAALALAALDRMREECRAQQRGAVFGLALHPWVCGMSSRIGPLRRLLQDLAQRPNVHWTRPGAIAQDLLSSHRPS